MNFYEAWKSIPCKLPAINKEMFCRSAGGVSKWHDEESIQKVNVVLSIFKQEKFQSLENFRRKFLKISWILFCATVFRIVPKHFFEKLGKY